MLIFLARVRGYRNPSILPEGHRFFYRIIPTPHNHKIYFRGTGFRKGTGLYISVIKKPPGGQVLGVLNKKQHELSF
jgi:hypothetical protein